MKPSIASEIAAPEINKGTAIAVQFRYAFITDADGLKVVDVTDARQGRAWCRRRRRRSPTRAACMSPAPTPTSPAGKGGLVIVDVEKPEQPDASTRRSSPAAS